MKRNEEKKPIPWEVADPRPPVIRSGKTESKVHRDGDDDGDCLKMSG